VFETRATASHAEPRRRRGGRRASSAAPRLCVRLLSTGFHTARNPPRSCRRRGCRLRWGAFRTTSASRCPPRPCPPANRPLSRAHD